MEANRKEVDPSDQELEGSTIAGEISSVNHTTPCPSAPPTEGRVKLNNDQRRVSKRAADKRYNEKRKRNEDEMMEELEKLEEYSGKLELENGNLKFLRDNMEARVDEENNIILSQLVDNDAGQITEVQKARINFIGETSTGQDGLNEMNQAPITSNADTIFGENASMNLQTLPRSAQPAGSSGLPADKQVMKRIADKKRRDNRKWTINAAAARIKELKEKNVKLESDKAVLKAEANQLRKQFDQLRNIRKKMAFKDARRNAKLEKVLEGCMNHVQGSTLNTQLPFEVTGFGTGETGLPVHHPPVYQSGTTMGSGGLAVEDSPELPQSELSQGLTHLKLPWGRTPDNTFNTWEAGPPVHHPPVYLSPSHLSQGWPHENNFEQPDSTYGDQFIEFSGCSNNIDGSYI